MVVKVIQRSNFDKDEFGRLEIPTDGVYVIPMIDYLTSTEIGHHYGAHLVLNNQGIGSYSHTILLDVDDFFDMYLINHNGNEFIPTFGLYNPKTQELQLLLLGHNHEVKFMRFDGKHFIYHVNVVGFVDGNDEFHVKFSGTRMDYRESLSTLVNVCQKNVFRYEIV